MRTLALAVILAGASALPATAQVQPITFEAVCMPHAALAQALTVLNMRPRVIGTSTAGQMTLWWQEDGAKWATVFHPAGKDLACVLADGSEGIEKVG